MLHLQNCAQYISTLYVFPRLNHAHLDDSTLDAIAENAMLFYKKSLNIENKITCEYLTNTLIILDANVDIVYTRQQGILSVSNKHRRVRSIVTNAPKNTGFVLCFSDFCLVCIFSHKKLLQNIV